jgi:hypothetical protein
LWTTIERICEVGGLSNFPRRFVQFDIDFNEIAFADPGGGAVGSTDPYKVLPAHCRHPAAPGVAIDRDGYGRAARRPERFHNFVRHLNACRIAGRNDLSPELHLTTTCNVNSAVVRLQAR